MKISTTSFRMEEGSIKPIDRTSVHKICSGQVVLTLATAIKELVENSIDAGATIIDVKLEEHGSKSIEVSDNGKGVKACDFQSLTLKHHTSKIADFSDLPFVSTFGFRGEALSSLCALSDLEVTTRHSDTEIGTYLKFDHNGHIIKNTSVARQVGTSVLLKNIFSTYPVRHKEFIRHIRREFAKMIQVLSAYCLISTNKRITCTHVTEKGKKNVVLSTHNSKNLRDNIVSLFSDKQVKQLMEIKQCNPSDDVLKEYFLPESATEKSKVFQLEGFISNSSHGEGRSSSDRQFYYISGRPCDLPKVSKLINEVYHLFNKHQYPFVLLNISLKEGFADVNVTPDKRQIFIPDEKVLLALVKTSLLAMYGSQPAQITMSPLTLMTLKKNTENASFSGPSVSTNTVFQTEVKEPSSKRKFDIPNIDSDDEEEPMTLRLFKSQKFDSQLIAPKSNADSGYTSSPSLSLSQESVCSSSQNSVSKEDAHEEEIIKSEEKIENKDPMDTVNFTLTLPFNEEKVFKKMSPLKSGHDKLKAILNAAQKYPNQTQDNVSKERKRNKTEIREFEKIGNYYSKGYTFEEITKPAEEPCTTIFTGKIEDATEIEEVEHELDKPSSRTKKYKTIYFSMDMLRQTNEKGTETKAEDDEEKCSFQKFRSKILPTDNQKAEEELKKEISKESFSKMDIIGQFNLGFIVTRLHDDLFIIDQHATDEKYNFELLQKETVLETQLLFQPQPLNLAAVSEAILLDNLHVFEKNGFKFQINEESPSGEKIQLVSVPVSQNWKLGKEDVDELIFMLTDNPIRMVRPSRVSQMFASRACRKSVMIGSALTMAMMKKLVSHMGEIEQPWNCPHGRPTMRHLFNLSLLNPI